MKFVEMHKDIQDAFVYGFMRRFGVREEAAREYLDDHPETTASDVMYLEPGSDAWYEVLNKVVWGDMSQEEIKAACKT